MAYNRPYNPDELPRFAEPEPKPGAPKYSNSTSSTHSRYENKPQPPVPPQSGGGRMYSGGLPQRPDVGRLPPGSYDGNGHPNTTMSPPPDAMGPRPATHNRPLAGSQPPPSPVPADRIGNPDLLPIFRTVDKNRTGQLSELELKEALVNGDWTAFDQRTVEMMIRMFDSDRSGTIGFEEFCGLWSFLASWRELFDRFDDDGNGYISLEEFRRALKAFKYRVTPGFVEAFFATYAKRDTGVMTFDLFVQACISLKRMTDIFKRYDDDRDGYITLSFEDFVIEILRQLK